MPTVKMATIPTPTSELPPRRRRFVQFSLLNLFMATVAVGFGTAYFNVARQLAHAHRQLQADRVKQEAQQWQINRLQAELGVITITDPTKVHLLSLTAQDTDHWKWRVYWPSSSCSLKIAIGEIRAKGFDVVPVKTLNFGMSGQMTVEASLRRDLEGQHVFTVQIPGRNLKTDFKLTDQQAAELTGGTSIHLAGGGGTTEIVATPGPIELLRDRAPQTDLNLPGNRIWDGSEPSFDVLVWLE